MTVWLEVEGKKRRVELPAGFDARVGGVVECVVDGVVVALDACVLQPGVMSVVVAGRQYRCVLDGDAVLVDGRRYGFAVDDPRSLQGRRGAGAGT
jgi:hypothetical protein